MKLSTRERMIVAFLPAVLTAIAYVYLYARPARFAIEALHGEKGKSGKVESIDGLFKENERLTDALDAEKEKATALQAREQKIEGGQELAARRAQAWKTMSALFEKHHLRLVSSSRQADPSKSAALSPDLKAWTPKQKERQPQLWRIELNGNYGDARRTMEDLSLLKEFIIPVSLEMDATSAEAPAQWWLEVWL